MILRGQKKNETEKEIRRAGEREDTYIAGFTVIRSRPRRDDAAF